jgi:hypothetical protein
MRINFFKNAISGIFSNHKKNKSDNNNTETTASLSGRNVTQSYKPISQDNQQTNSFEIPKQLTLKQRVIKSFKGILKFFFNRFQKDNLETNINSYNGAVTKNDNQQAKVIEELKEKLVGIKAAKELVPSPASTKENADEQIHEKSKTSYKNNYNNSIYETPINPPKTDASNHTYDKLNPSPRIKENASNHTYDKLNTSPRIKENASNHTYEKLNLSPRIKENSSNHTYENIDNLKEKPANQNGYQVPKSTPKPRTQ